VRQAVRFSSPAFGQPRFERVGRTIDAHEPLVEHLRQELPRVIRRTQVAVEPRGLVAEDRAQRPAARLRLRRGIHAQREVDRPGECNGEQRR